MSCLTLGISNLLPVRLSMIAAILVRTKSVEDKRCDVRLPDPWRLKLRPIRDDQQNAQGSDTVYRPTEGFQAGWVSPVGILKNHQHGFLVAQRLPMEVTTNRDRVLRLKTELQNRDAIVVSIEDSGPAFDQDQLHGMIDAFVTTKSHGIGLGLAICNMIVERHGGQLTAVSDGKNGAQFQFSLPVTSVEQAAHR
jgi:Histidine kinase-, DNA gyrase B-, and HSP90-like ATPase